MAGNNVGSHKATISLSVSFLVYPLLVLDVGREKTLWLVCGIEDG